MKIFFETESWPFPPLWRWRSDLSKILKSGCDGIRMEIPWILLEKAPGLFDISILTPYLDAVRECRLKLICAPVCVPPKWVEESMLSEKFEFFAEYLIKKLGRTKNLAAWDLSGCIPEKRMETPETIFPEYLEKRFGDISELNRKWNRNYFGFDLVPCCTPGCFSDRAESLAFEAFRIERADFFQDIFRKKAQKDSKNIPVRIFYRKKFSMMEICEEFIRGTDMLIADCWAPERSQPNFGTEEPERPERVRVFAETLALIREKAGSFKLSEPEILLISQGDSPSKLGWIQALGNAGLAYGEADSAKISSEIRFIVMTEKTVLSDDDYEKLLFFVRAGGCLFCESETGWYSKETGKTLRPDARWIAEATGASVAASSIAVPKNEFKMRFRGELFTITPAVSGLHRIPVLKNFMEILIPGLSGKDAFLVRMPYGNGHLFLSAWPFGASSGLCGVLPSLAIFSGCRPPAAMPRKKDELSFRILPGTFGMEKAILVFTPQRVEKAEIQPVPGFFSGTLKEVVSGKNVSLSGGKIKWKPCQAGISIFVQEKRISKK